MILKMLVIVFLFPSPVMDNHEKAEYWFKTAYSQVGSFSPCDRFQEIDIKSDMVSQTVPVMPASKGQTTPYYVVSPGRQQDTGLSGAYSRSNSDPLL